MDIEVLRQKLYDNKNIYIRDDYEQMAIKIIPNGDDVLVFAKFKNQAEYSIDKTSKLVFEIKQNGNEITEEEYKNY